MKNTYQKIDILGIPMAVFESYEHAVRSISSRIQAQRKTFCVAINPEKIYCSRKDHVLRQVLLKADMGICDGIGTGLAAKILHGRYVPRCTGVDLFFMLGDEAARNNWRIYLLGASEAANEGTYNTLKRKYPKLQIAGRHNGYLEKDKDVIEQINASRADLLFVAMGSPQQEIWIYEHVHQLQAKFFLGVGGAFDIISGQVKRAPSWVRRLGLEFFYRFLQFPTRTNRYFRRQLFALQVFIEKLKQIFIYPPRV
jgi:N-acetylglucosaminyldiphosphoundecaprenol N-acetyl-beta-D-mannosaminyltransferase